jgi:hypothetical protein
VHVYQCRGLIPDDLDGGIDPYVKVHYTLIHYTLYSRSLCQGYDMIYYTLYSLYSRSILMSRLSMAEKLDAHHVARRTTTRSFTRL